MKSFKRILCGLGVSRTLTLLDGQDVVPANIRKGVQADFKIDNMFNVDPQSSPQTNTGLGAKPALYDLLGRFYRVGLRFSY